MKALTKLLLPIFVTSFCCGLSACTDDSKSSEIVLESSAPVQVNKMNCEEVFNISVEEESFPDDDPTTYECKAKADIISQHYKVYEIVNISVEVRCLYKIEANTSTGYEKIQDCEITVHSKKGYSSKLVFTFDKPIEEYPYFVPKCTVKDASGSIIKND